MQRLFVFLAVIFTAASGLGSAAHAASPSPASPSASSSSATSASAPADSAVTLEPVVVTATRIAEPVSQTSSSVTVITARDIEDNGYRTLVDALQGVPGVSTTQTGGLGQNTGLFIRGMATNQSLILVDGKRLPQDLAGGYDLADLSLDNVERIEVVRGPLSAVQGGSAAGGVINLITKKGTGLKKPEYSVTLEAGSYNTFREALSARGAQGKVDYSAAFSSLLTTNQRRNNDYERENAGANLGYQAYDNVRLSLDTAYRVTTAQNPGKNVGSQKNDPAAAMLWETWSVGPTVEWKTTEVWTQTFSLQHTQQRTYNNNDPAYTGTNDNRNQDNSNEVDWNHTFAVLDNLTVTSGTQIEDKNIWQFDNHLDRIVYNNHQTNKSAYAGLDWEALPGWHLDPSVRMDGFSDFGDYWNWRAATSYVLPATKTKFKSSYGTATTPPADQNFMTFGGTNVPNYSLQAEQTQGWEAGVEQPFLGGKYTVGATYFENDTRNTIEYVGMADYNSTSINASRTRAQGVELTAGLHPVPEFDLTSSFTYLDDHNLDGYSSSYGNLAPDTRPARRPRRTTAFDAVGRPWKGVTLSLGMEWVAAKQDVINNYPDADLLPDYTTSRFAASWQVSKNVQLFGRIENLLNNHYEEAYGYPALDQAFYGGVKLMY